MTSWANSPYAGLAEALWRQVIKEMEEEEAAKEKKTAKLDSR